MPRSKPHAHEIKKHPDVQRDAMEDIRGAHYNDPNRDRALGDADRTGRHFDERTDESDEEEVD